MVAGETCGIYLPLFPERTIRGYDDNVHNVSPCQRKRREVEEAGTDWYLALCYFSFLFQSNYYCVYVIMHVSASYVLIDYVL